MIYHIVTAVNDDNPNLKAGLYSLHWGQLRARKTAQPLATIPPGTWPPQQINGPLRDAADVVDRILGHRIKRDKEVVINIKQRVGDANAEVDGTSSGLSYGLFIYDAIYQKIKGRRYESNEKEWVFATGKVEASGAITEVGDIFKKLKLVLEYLDKHDVETVSFLYPVSCKAAYHEAVDALKKEQGEQVVAEKLKRFKCILGVSSLTQAVKALGIDSEAKEVSLFRGLQSFEFQDRTHFAGRKQTTDAAINQLIKKLNDEQNKARSGVLLLTGLNGSGKSSLAKAGILPSLVEAAGDRKHPHHVCDSVIYPKHGNSSQPLGTLPIQQGLSGFINAFVSFLRERVGLNVDGDAASIRTDPDSFITNVSQQLKSQKNQSLVMVIDQLEEVFQWPGSEVWEKETTVCDASVFFDLINRLVSQCQGLIFITTLRSEFFSRFDRSYHFQENSPERSTRETALTTFKNESSQLFGVASDLNGEQWSAILSQQLEWAGLEETTESDHSKLRQTGRYIETRLVGDLLKDAMNESHALPLASFCLQYLYEEAEKRQQPNTPLVLTWRDYVGSIYADAEDKATKYQDRVGLGLIAKKAENILTQAFIQSGLTTPTEAEKSALANTFFMAFIEKAEDFEQLTKSRLSDEKLQALLKKRYKQGAKELTAFGLLLQGFTGSHLLIKEYHEGVTTYQIAHDALISKWQRVKQWFVDEKAFIVWFAQASTQFRLWEKSGLRKPLLEGSLLSGGKTFLKDSTKDLFELEGYVKRSLFNSRRNWTVFASAIAIVILAITILYTNAADERDRALNRESNYLMDQARQKVEQGDYDTALLLALNAYPNKIYGNGGKPKYNGPLYQALTKNRKVSVIELPKDLLIETKKFFVSHYDNEIELRSIDSGEVDSVITHNDGISDIRISHNNKILALKSKANRITLIDIESKEPLPLSGHNGMIKDFLFDPDTKRLAVSFEGGDIVLWSIPSGKILNVFKSDCVVTHLSFSLGDDLLASACSRNVYDPSDVTNLYHLDAIFQGTVKVWRSNSDKPIKILKSDDIPQKVVFSDDGKLLLVSYVSRYRAEGLLGPTFDSEAVISLDNGDVLHEVASESFNSTTAFVSNGVLSVDGDLMVLWNKDSGTTRPLDLHTKEITHIDISTDGKKLVSSSEDGSAIIWSLETGRFVRKLDELGSVHHVSFNPSGTVVASISDEGPITLWSTATGKPLFKFNHYDSRFSSGKFSESDDMFWAYSDCCFGVSDTPFYVGWSLKPITQWLDVDSEVLPPKPDYLRSLNGDYYLDLIQDEHTVLVKRASGELAFRLEHGFTPVDERFDRSVSWDSSRDEIDLDETSDNLKGFSFARFSQDGSKILTATRDNKVVVWSVSEEAKIKTYTDYSDIIYAGFSEDSKNIWIITEGVATLLSIHGEETLKYISLKPSYSAYISKDETIIFTEDHRTVNVWSIETGENLESFEKPEYWGGEMHFYLGENVVFRSGDGDLLMNNTPLDLVAKHAISRLPVGRTCLTPHERQEYFLEPLSKTQSKARNCPQYYIE